MTLGWNNVITFKVSTCFCWPKLMNPQKSEVKKFHSNEIVWGKIHSMDSLNASIHVIIYPVLQHIYIVHFVFLSSSASCNLLYNNNTSQFI